VCSLAGQDLARLCCCLEARRGVHDWSGDEELAGRSPARGRLTRLDANPYLQRFGQPDRLTQPTGAAADREAGADGPQRVIVMYLRHAKHRHDGIADKLLRPAPERLQLGGGCVEKAPQHVASPLGIQSLGEACRVNQVGEQDRDQLALRGLEQ
jgi:hypothetical protein